MTINQTLTGPANRIPRGRRDDSLGGAFPVLGAFTNCLGGWILGGQLGAKVGMAGVGQIVGGTAAAAVNLVCSGIALQFGSMAPAYLLVSALVGGLVWGALSVPESRGWAST
ncbi:MAG: hypothetical protein AB1758_03165 [Candidatus Eremiobacterota bacterium]